MAGAHEQDEVRGLREFYSKGDQSTEVCEMHLTLTLLPSNGALCLMITVRTGPSVS